ncbi:hypothetical protein ACQPW1_39805 [Nocardia sp. CA-128927]|uniref:hypothetical protein n=1 Tax=Nocardia sp. CA-128927 TaxID=3239975 RepID=UPI003D98E581
MPWFKVDDGFANSAAVVRIPRRYRVTAVGLWTLAGTWCSKELTDGFVPVYLLDELGASKAIAEHLVKAGLWHTVEGGWQFACWAPDQPTRAQVLEAREKEAERKRRWREAKTGKSRPVASGERPGGTTPSVPPGSHPESVLPDPTRPDPTRPTTYLERQSHVSTAHDDETPRGPAVDGHGWKLVREAIPDEHPHATRTDLAIRAGALLKSGTPEADVREALTLWLGKPKLGPATLPSLVSEVVRNRSRPTTPTGDGAATTKARGWLDLAEGLDHGPPGMEAIDPNPLEQKAIQA